MSFRNYLQPKRDEIDREREKKNLLLNSIHTRPRKKIPKKIAKKFKKLKNPFSALFLANTGLDRPRKGKKIQPRILFILDPGKKIPKKIEKKSKN